MLKVFLGAIIIASALVIAGVDQAVADGRVGNNAYQSLSTLANPGADAGGLARLLSENGFEVLSCDGQRPGCFDLNREGLQDALETLTDKAKGKEVALVFFSGHGMQGPDGNVLAPVDMRVDCAENTMRRGVLLNDLLKAVAGARQKIVMLDACRNNPLPQCPSARGFVAVSFGALSVPDAESFMLVSSTKPGQVALDGLPGQHSPFARALFYWLDKSPDIYFHQLLSHVAKMVIEDTTRAKFTQVPEMLVRGVAPEACLKGQGCSADPQAAALRAELESLKTERARDQDLTQIANAYLSKVGIRSVGKPLSEEEKQRALAGIEDAGRALVSRGDDAGERALQSLKDGKAAEAERLFAEVLETEAKAAAERKAKAAQAAKHLAALAKPKDVVKAAEYYRRATELDPEDAQAWDDYARVALDAGRTAEARTAFEQAALRAQNGTELAYWAMLGLGDVAAAQGNLPSARQLYERAAAMAEPIAKADPGNAGWQRDLSGSHDRIGNVLRAQGNLPAALQSYRASLAIAERLSKADPGNAETQRDLAVSHVNIGQVLVEQGNLPAALESYRASLAITSRLAKADPGNAEAQRDVGASLNFVGNVYLAQGKLAEALEEYVSSRDISARLAKVDPGNAGWQRDLAVSHIKIGNVLVEQGNLPAALESYRASLAITSRLAKADPGNAEAQRDLAVSLNFVANVYLAQGNLPAALESHRASLAIAERLAKADPGNAQWQRDLAISNELIGNVRASQKETPQAIEAFQRALAIYRELMLRNPDDVQVRLFSVVPLWRIGVLKRKQGRNELQEALAILKPLAAADRLDANRRDWIPQIEKQIAALKDNVPARRSNETRKEKRDP